MTTSIELARQYGTAVDYAYRYGSKTAVLDIANKLIKEIPGTVGTFLIPNITTSGLADHTLGGSFVEGETAFSYEPYTADFDRSRKIPIDAVDNAETRNVVVPAVIAEFMNGHTTPETDAIRMATYATAAIAAGYGATAVLTVADIVDAIDVGSAALDDAQVPEEGRILFIVPQKYSNLKNSSDINRNSIVNMGTDEFNRNIKSFDEMQIVKIPQARAYTAIKLLDGVTGGETDGGYEEDAAGYDINFMIVHPSSVMQFAKHQKNKLFTPDSDDNGDNFRYLYRLYHGCDKLTAKHGIYVHYSTS